MRRKQTPFVAKIAFVPIKGITAPPRAGPIIPAISSCSPLKTDAEGSSSSDTMSVSKEANAGALKAKPAPIRNAKSRTRLPSRRCDQPRIASAPADAANQMGAILTNFARSTMSARAPAGKEDKKNGSGKNDHHTDKKKGRRRIRMTKPKDDIN